MRIFIGADHRGFELKENIIEWLKQNNISFQDVGAHDYNESDDYPVYAQKMAESVAADLSNNKDSRGIIICGSGIGVDIVANKFDGIRAGLAASREQVEAARQDDDINVLAIAADYTSLEKTIELIDAFLNTEYDEQARRKRRLDEIKKIEENN